MNSINSIKSNWPSIKLQLKQKYPQLNEADLKYVAGYENEFFHNLEIKLGINRDQLMTILNSMKINNNF